MDDSSPVRTDRPPCPRCGSRDVARILYEPTSWGDDLGQRLASGDVVLGEICRCNGDAAWACNACGFRFGHDGGGSHPATEAPE